MSLLDAWNQALLARWAAPPTPLWLDPVAVGCARSGPPLLSAALVGVWLWGCRSRKEYLTLLEATEAGLLGLGINQAIAWVYFHPRPYMLGLVRPLLTHTYETSFPSDHATLLFAVGLFLLGSARLRWVGVATLVLGGITSWGRIYTGVHFPLDIVGSAAVALAACGGIRASRRVWVGVNNPMLLWYERIFSGAIDRGWVRAPVSGPE